MVVEQKELEEVSNSPNSLYATHTINTFLLFPKAKNLGLYHQSIKHKWYKKV